MAKQCAARINGVRCSEFGAVLWVRERDIWVCERHADALTNGEVLNLSEGE